MSDEVTNNDSGDMASSSGEHRSVDDIDNQVDTDVAHEYAWPQPAGSFRVSGRFPVKP